MSVLFGFLSGLCLAIAAVGAYYLRGVFEWHFIRFQGKRWIQPAGGTSMCGRRPTWRTGIAVRLRRGQHLVAIRR